MPRQRTRYRPRSRYSTDEFSAASGGSPGSIAWHVASWAEGTEFKALALANGAAVTTWPDEVGTRDWTQAVAADKPIYRSSVAKFANRPAIDASGAQYMVGSAWALTQPFSVVVIFAYDALTGGSTFLSLDGTTNGQPSIGELFTLITVAADQGPLATSAGISTTSCHLGVAFFNDNTSFIEIDGVRTTGDAGPGNPAGVPSLFTLATALDTTNWAGECAWVSGIAGDVTTDPDWPLFKQFARSHYGVPVV